MVALIRQKTTECYGIRNRLQMTKLRVAVREYHDRDMNSEYPSATFSGIQPNGIESPSLWFSLSNKKLRDVRVRMYHCRIGLRRMMNESRSERRGLATRREFHMRSFNKLGCAALLNSSYSLCRMSRRTCPQGIHCARRIFVFVSSK